MKSMILFLIYLFSLNCFAVDGYVIPAAGSEDIDEHSDCQQIVNTGTLAIFVPTKTNAEWQSFQTNKPAVITINTCPPAGGTWANINSCVVSTESQCPGGVAPSGACGTVGERCYIGVGCGCWAGNAEYECQ